MDMPPITLSLIGARGLDYAQTKAAIVSFTKSLAKQLGDKGIRVNAVAPGPVWLPLQVTGGQPPKALETFGAYTPMDAPASRQSSLPFM